MAHRSLVGARGIVTGASSGIGRALAVELCGAGAKIVVTARRANLLEQLVHDLNCPADQVHFLPGDITDAAHREALLEFASKRLGGLDLLVNNAGIGATREFAQADANALRQLFEVNFFAPVEMIRGALPLLRAGRSPIIVNVSSVLGHRAAPRKTAYCASKFALHGFSDALRAELVADKIDVLIVSPSTTDTEFFAKSGGGPPSFGRRWLTPMSPNKVARKTIRAMEQGRSEILLSIGGRAIVWLDRLLPSLANRVVAKWG